MKPRAQFSRVVALWCVFLTAAILNGTLRQKVLVGALGDAVAHVLSSVLLSSIIVGVTWLALPWLRVESTRNAWRVGGSWLVLTLAFEFLAGHYWFKAPWSSLFADYNLAEGRVWVLVLLATLLAPVMARARQVKKFHAMRP